MIDIKFRGKRVDNNEWVYGQYVKRNDEMFPSVIFVNFNDSKSFEYHSVHPESVCRYAGLKDKNGKEIYEGDIFKKTSCKSPKGISSAHNIFYHVPQMFVVEYISNAFVGKNKNDTIMYSGNEFHGGSIVQLEEIEILGNIHDNPELLK